MFCFILDGKHYREYVLSVLIVPAHHNRTHKIMHHAFKTWCIVSTNGRYAMLCNQKRYCTGKPRNHNGFWAFSYPDFQVQTKRYFSLLRGLELPTPRFLAAFERAITPEGRLFSFPLKIFSKRSSLKCMDDLTACSGKRFALHFGANLTKLNNTVIHGLTL